MRGGMKKLTAALLTTALLFGTLGAGLPEVNAVSEETLCNSDYAVADTVIDRVYEIAEEAASPVNAISDYLVSCPEVEESSIQINGQAVLWQLLNGIVCSYSPDIQELSSEASTQSLENSPDTETISYARRGVKHGSDVYLFEPYYGLSDDFTDLYQGMAKKLAAKSGATYHYYKGDAATVDAVADALESGGVIILNSHGTTDYSGSDVSAAATTSYLCLQTGDGITVQDYQNGHASYGGTRDGLSYYQVDGTALTDHMDRQGSNGLVWMAICLGMATDGLSQPLLDNGADVVYGYSESVTFKGEACFASYFFDSLMEGNTVATAIDHMKSECGEWDYSPELCQKAGLSTFYMASTKEEAQKRKAAFPIVASSEDRYPGQDRVNDTQQVSSSWKLSDQYSITARTADSAKGTVSVNGLSIISTPAEGYAAKGCTVEPQDAAVITQSGNNFRVSQLRQDCTITVEFEQREHGTVSFQTPDGVDQADITGYLGDTILLPTPSGTPRSDSYAYVFSGWSETPLEQPVKTSKRYRAGESYRITSSAQTLYAVYQYIGDTTGAACVFTEPSASKTDWSGMYIFSVDHKVVPSDGTFTEFSVGGKSSWVAAKKLGMSIGSNSIALPSQAATFRISRIAGSDSYVIRMGGTSNTAYLAMTADCDTVSTTANFGTEDARWRIDLQDGALLITSVKYPERTLRCVRNGTGRYLACVPSGGEQIHLYQAPAGAAIWYTTLCITNGTTNIAMDVPTSVSAGNTITGTLTIDNQGTQNRTAALYCAQYDANGKMLSVTTLAPVYAPAGEMSRVRLSDITPAAGAATVKLMVLDSETMEPLCNERLISIE